eukprot:scaffold5804_cov63-Phaeocystis_antarctica.AAC.1
MSLTRPAASCLATGVWIRGPIELVPCLSRLSVRVSVFNVNNPSFVTHSLRVIAPARPHPHVAWTISAPEIMAVGASELTNDWHLLWAASTLVQY